jgi:beta-phosphoglucomutase-like phosphatase (HAD superfamily)
MCRVIWHTPAMTQFPVIVAGEEVAAKQPAPDAYLFALWQLGLSTVECIADEHRGNGVHATRAEGPRIAATPSLYAADDGFSDATWLWPDRRAQTIR